MTWHWRYPISAARLTWTGNTAMRRPATGRERRWERSWETPVRMIAGCWCWDIGPEIMEVKEKIKKSEEKTRQPTNTSLTPGPQSPPRQSTPVDTLPDSASTPELPSPTTWLAVPSKPVNMDGLFTPITSGAGHVDHEKAEKKLKHSLHVGISTAPRPPRLFQHSSHLQASSPTCSSQARTHARSTQ